MSYIMSVLNSWFKSDADSLDSYRHNTQAVASFLEKITKIVRNCNVFYNIMPWGERVQWWLLSSSRCNAHRFSCGLGNTLGYNPQYEKLLRKIFSSYFNAAAIKEIYPTTTDEIIIQERITAIQEDLSKKYCGEILFEKFKEYARWGTCSAQSDLLTSYSRLLKTKKISLEISKIENYLLDKIDVIFRYQTLGHILALSENQLVCSLGECFPSNRDNNGCNISYDLPLIPLNNDFPSALEKSFETFFQSDAFSAMPEKIFFGSVDMNNKNGEGLHSMFFHIDCSDPQISRLIIYDPNSGLYQYNNLKELCEGVFDITEARNKSPFISSHRSAASIQLKINF